MSRTRLLVAAAIATFALVAVPIAAARQKAQTVTVGMTEFKFALSPRTVHPGTVTFKLVNKGKLAHDFSIAGKTSPKVPAGKTATLKVVLKKGKYPYKCTVPGHAAAGMHGLLTVG